ncbi:MAG: hypothetical protein DRP78_05550 [Candidatus Omnitrophota bacterium]|nr:MAG: hypothetical protein DRP78_05550 [Candidatus Omnitrophota bacterium]
MNGLKAYQDILKTLLKNNKKLCLLMLFIILLYVSVVVIFKYSLSLPMVKQQLTQRSALCLVEFIHGFRAPAQDFEIKDLRFGKNFLSFVLEIKFRPKFVIIVKKLAIDIILGLTAEYPELKSINISVKRKLDSGAEIVYGKAVFSGNNDHITWSF